MVQDVFTVASAGDYRHYYLVQATVDGGTHYQNAHLTLTYFPTNYGTVSTMASTTLDDPENREPAMESTVNPVSNDDVPTVAYPNSTDRIGHLEA